MKQLTNLVQHAEYHRDETSINTLQRYIDQRPELFNKMTALGKEIEDSALLYLSGGDELKRSQMQNEMESLKQQLIEDDDTIHYLLATEVIMSFLLYRFSLTKLMRHYGYSGSTETRKVSNLQACFLRSLKEYKKITGKIPDVNFNQFNQNIYQRS